MTSTEDEIKAIIAEIESHEDLQYQFEDNMFPADMNSVGVYQNDEMFEWHSLNTLCQGETQLFVDGVQSDDVVAGELNDGWFLTALSLVATQSKLLRWLFVDELSRPPHGLYTMRFFMDGEWKLVYIDDRMPCSPSNACHNPQWIHHPVFAHGKDANETWMMVLEKGCAKLHGSYGGMEAKSAQCGVAHALRLLTGGDTGTVPTSSITSYAVLEAMLQPRQVGVTVLTLAVRDDGGAVDAQAADGIIRSHAYTVVGQCQVETEDHIEALVKLRNPWNSQEWSGDWSDSSARWTPEMQARLNHQPVVDDGEFYMSLQDMCKIYTRLVWVQVRPEASENGLTGGGANGWKRTSTSSEWKLASDKQSVYSQGGCPNHLSWWTNPQFSLRVDRPCSLQIALEQPAGHLQACGECKNQEFRGYFTIGFSLFEQADEDESNMCVLSPVPQMEVLTSEYCANQSVSACISLWKPGFYKIVPTTLRPGGLGKFSLVVRSLETDRKGKIGPGSKLEQQPADFPFELGLEPMLIKESQRRILNASLREMSDRLHIAEAVAQRDTVIDLINVGECGVVSDQRTSDGRLQHRYWGLVVHVYGRRTSQHTKWVEEQLLQRGVPFIFIDFSLDGNGKLPPHVRDGIRERTGGEGFQLPVVVACGEVIVAGLKHPPINEDELDEISLDYQWQHHDEATVIVQNQQNELSKLRLSSNVIRSQCASKIAKLTRQYQSATVEIDAVSLRFRISLAEQEKAHAEVLLRQVQAEAAAEEKLALLAELRQEKQNQLDSPATDALLAMIDDQPEPETVSEIANKIVQRMDEDRWLDEKTFRLSRGEAAHRAVNSLFARPELDLQPVMEETVVHDVAQQVMEKMAKRHSRVAFGGRELGDAANDAIREVLTKPKFQGVAKNQKRPEEIAQEEAAAAAAEAAAAEAAAVASSPKSPGSPGNRNGDEDDEDDGREVWPSPPKPRERRMVIEVFDPESPDGETMSPNARAICAELKRAISENQLPMIAEGSQSPPGEPGEPKNQVVQVDWEPKTGNFVVPVEPEPEPEPEPEDVQPLRIVSILGADMEPYGTEFGFWLDVANMDPPKNAWFKEEGEPAVWVPDLALVNTLPLKEWQPRASKRVEGKALQKLKAAKARMAEMHTKQMKMWFADRGKKMPESKELMDGVGSASLAELKQARAAATAFIRADLEHQFKRVMVHEPDEEELEKFKAKIGQAMTEDQAKQRFNDEFDFKYKYKYAYKYVYTN